jgi:outer membrane protein assembly factor BamD
MKKIVAAMLMTAGLVACSSTKGPADETRGWPIERLYGEARDELNSGNYTRAVQLYETLEARFPYGRYAQQAQMDLAYAHYKDKESQMALAACDRFIKLHPAHGFHDDAKHVHEKRTQWFECKAQSSRWPKPPPNHR